jgi:hypothetical protein
VGTHEGLVSGQFLDSYAANVIHTDFNRSGSPFSPGEKVRMREIRSSTFVDDFDPLTRREREKRTVPLPKGEGEKIVPLLQGEGEKDSSCPGGTGTVERNIFGAGF